MSCDWDIKCVDCDEEHGFDDMNHKDDLMHVLIRHADAIAAFHTAMCDRDMDDGVGLATKYPERRINTAFFKKHQGHRLRPVNEYGQLSGDCSERVDCPSCGASHPCKLPDGHETTGEPHR